MSDYNKATPTQQAISSDGNNNPHQITSSSNNKSKANSINNNIIQTSSAFSIIILLMASITSRDPIKFVSEGTQAGDGDSDDGGGYAEVVC